MEAAARRVLPGSDPVMRVERETMKKTRTWKKDLKTSVQSIQVVAPEMKAWLSSMEDQPETWTSLSWGCLELLWSALSREHGTARPEMACRRSGRCCTKQVPRVSAYEIEYIAHGVLTSSDPEPVLDACRKSVLADYQDPILGEGVPCPLLGKDDDGRATCVAHDRRPMTCRLSSVSTPLSWDCPLWKVHGTHFPTLSPDLVRPFLDLFAYCRSTYARIVLGVQDRRQMFLIGTGILAYAGERPPASKNPLVISALSHHDRCSDDLYMRHMTPPPPEENEHP